MKGLPKLISAFFFVFFLFFDSLIGQPQQQRLMLLPGSYSLIGNSIKLNSACIDEARRSPTLQPSSIKFIQQGDAKVKIEGLETVLTLAEAINQGYLAFEEISGYSNASLIPTLKTKGKKIDVEIVKGAVIGEPNQNSREINKILFQIDWTKRPKGKVQDEVWTVQNLDTKLLDELNLFSTQEITNLLDTKNYDSFFNKIYEVQKNKTYQLLNSERLSDLYSKQILNKDKVYVLRSQKQFQELEHDIEKGLEISRYPLENYYKSSLLIKEEINLLLVKREYDLALSKIKTASSISNYLDDLEVYQRYGLITKGEIETLIGKKQFDPVIARFKIVEALLEVMPSIDECYEYKLLDKAEIQALLIKKQYDVALSKFESIESLYKVMPSIDECYEYKLLDKAEIEALISNKRFDQVQAKFKEKSQFYQTYNETKHNWDNYHVLGLVTNEARASLLNEGKHAELVGRLTQSEQKYREIANQSPVLRLNGTNLIKYNENYFEIERNWRNDISASKFDFDYNTLNRNQNYFWRRLEWDVSGNDAKPAYLYPGAFNATASSAKLHILDQEPLDIKAGVEQVFDDILQKSIDYISSQPEDRPIFIAKDHWANSSEFGQFSEGVKIKKMANSDVQMINSTELYVQLKRKFPNRRNIYLGGNIEKDMEFLNMQKEVSPLVQGVHDVVIYKSPSQFKVEREPLTPAVVGAIQNNNLTVLDLNQYPTFNDLPKNLEATKAVVVTGHNNEVLVAYLTWLADNGFLKGKYVYALTCYEDYSTPVLTEVLNKGGARSINFFSTKLNEAAVGKVLIELPKLLASSPAGSEKKELLQWIEFAAGKLKKEDLSPFLQQQYGKLLDGVQMTSEK